MNQLKLVSLGALVALLSFAVGTFASGPLPATAQTQPTTYQECFFGGQEPVDIDSSATVETPNQDRLIRVPSGWTVVSGGGNEDLGIILFCR